MTGRTVALCWVLTCFVPECRDTVSLRPQRDALGRWLKVSFLGAKVSFIFPPPHPPPKKGKNDVSKKIVRAHFIYLNNSEKTFTIFSWLPEKDKIVEAGEGVSYLSKNQLNLKYRPPKVRSFTRASCKAGPDKNQNLLRKNCVFLHV